MIRLSSTVFVAFLMCGCSLITKIDVCDRGRPEEHQVNRRTEGFQVLMSPRALTVMPGGLAFLVFSSQIRSGDLEETPFEVRGTLIGADGEPVVSCSSLYEYTYSTVEPTAPNGTMRHSASVAAALNEEDLGLLVFLASDPAREGNWVHGLQIDPIGCPVLEEVRLDDSEGLHVNNVVAAPLGEDIFVVLWPSVGDWLTLAETTIRARVVRVRRNQGIEFLPTEPSLSGEPVELSAEGFNGVAVDALPIGDGRFAVVWLVYGNNTSETWFAIYDDRLETVVEPRMVASISDQNGLVDNNQLAFARNGERYLVTWGGYDEDGKVRVFGALLDGEGGAVGSHFLLSDGTAERESRASVIAVPERGFLVAWEANRSASHADTDESGVRLAGLGLNGERLFLNPACCDSEAQLNGAHEGSQYSPVLALLPNGDVLAVWNDDSTNGTDLSGAGIRSASWPMRQLFPVE